MKKIVFTILIVLLCVLFQNCSSVNSIQDGRTLPKDKIEITPIVSFGKFASKTQNDNNKDEFEFNYYPNFSLRAKYGFKNNFDTGIIIDQSLNFGITTKHQFIGNQKAKFNVSFGVDLGFNLMAVFYEKLIYNYSIPLYISYNQNNYSIFITPRFINNSEYVFNNIHDKETIASKHNISRINISYGLLFGKKNKFGFEIQHNLSNILIPSHLALGYNIIN